MVHIHIPRVYCLQSEEYWGFTHVSFDPVADHSRLWYTCAILDDSTAGARTIRVDLESHDDQNER
jgi:hypothetical protein